MGASPAPHLWSLGTAPFLESRRLNPVGGGRWSLFIKNKRRLLVISKTVFPTDGTVGNVLPASALEPAPQGSARPTPSDPLTTLWPVLKCRPLDLMSPFPDPRSLVLGARILLLEDCAGAEDIFACTSKTKRRRCSPSPAIELQWWPPRLPLARPGPQGRGPSCAQGAAFPGQDVGCAHGAGGGQEESRGALRSHALPVSPDESVWSWSGGRSWTGSDEARVLVWHRLRAAVGGRKTAMRLVATIPNQALGHTV